jgi:hypothetical protein
MPRSTKRASTTDLDTLHRLTVRSLVAEIRRLKREKEPVPSSLLMASIKLLSVTGSTSPERPAKRESSPEMQALLATHISQEEEWNRVYGAGSREVDFTPPIGPARQFPEE